MTENYRRSLSHGMSLERLWIGEWLLNIDVLKSWYFIIIGVIQYVSKKFYNVIDSYKMITNRSRKGNLIMQ
jgi:hypothetical protein